MDKDSDGQLVRQKTDVLRAKIFDHVGSAAISEMPSERLDLAELSLAKSFGAARPTMRAALSTLIEEGVLTRAPHQPARIRHLTSEQVFAVFSARRPVELEAVRAICRRRLPIPQSVHESIRHLADLDKSTSPSAIARENLGFHRRVVAAANNEFILRCFASLEPLVALALAQSGEWRHARRAAESHWELLDQLETHSWSRSKRVFLDHLNESRVAIRDGVAERDR